ncbi:MAG: hypothetical protein ACTSRS_08615 [Candidatus Helarchaeota archaeon]
MTTPKDLYDTPSVERLVAGGTSVLIFGLLAGALGWIFMAIASQKNLGIGGDLLGFLTATTALNIIGVCISGGFHQSLSKFISEALVESREKALRYARAGFFIFILLGGILFAVFFTAAVIIFPHNLEYGIVFGAVAFAYLLDFFRDNIIGNLAATHRFDYIGKSYFFSGLITTLISFGILSLKYLLGDPIIVSQLLPLTVFLLIGIQIFILLRYYKKVMTYPFKATLRGAQWADIVPIFKYGLFCIIPNLIFSSAILWIQTLWYSGFFSFGTILVTANGLIIGYASIVLAICQFGWPQIPAVAEAKAMGDLKLVDAYMKNTLHTGFNLTSLFLIIYVGLSHQILLFFHGPEYLIAQGPFIILSISVGILGVEFLICTLLIGLGEGKKAAFIISTLALTQIFFVPLAIYSFYVSFGQDITLYAGPLVLLVVGIAIFPVTFSYLKRYTNNPSKIYLNILWKNVVSIGFTLLIYFFLDLWLFPLFQGPVLLIIIGFFLRITTLFLIFTFFMLFLAGYTDGDLDTYEKAFGSAYFLVKPFRWLLHHSPFYKKIEKNN